MNTYKPGEYVLLKLHEFYYSNVVQIVSYHTEVPEYPYYIVMAQHTPSVSGRPETFITRVEYPDNLRKMTELAKALYE